MARAEPDNRLIPLERAGRPDRFTHLQQEEHEYPDDTIDGERVHEIVTSNIQQRNRRPVGPGIVSVENRVLPLNAARHPVHDQHSSYTVQAKPAQLARLHRIIHSEEVQEGTLSHEVYREARHTELIYETAAPHSNRRIGCSVGPKTVGSVEKMHIETPNQIIQNRQKQPSQAIHNERTQVGCLDGVIHAERVQLEPVSQANHGEEACLQVINRTIGRADDWTAGCSVGHNNVSAEKRKTSTTNQVIQRAQKQQSDTIHAEHQIEQPDRATQREAMCFQPTKDYTARSSKRKISHLVDPKTIVKKRHIEPLSHVMQQAGETSDIDSHAMQVEFDHQNKGIGKHGKHKTRIEVDSNLTLKEQELVLSGNQLTHIYQEHVPPNDEVQKEQSEVKNHKQIASRAWKKNRKGLMSSSNAGLQLRRSKRLAKDSAAVLQNEPAESDPIELQVSSPNGQVSAGTMSSEPIEREPIQHRSASPNCEVSAAMTDTESVENERHEQYAVSPHQSMSDPPDIDRIIADLCPSTSSVHEKPKKVSNKPVDLNLAAPPSNPDMSDPERFARHYCLIFPLEVRRALAKKKSNSLLDRLMSEEGSDEELLHDLTDSEELLPASERGHDRHKPTGQNIGTKRKKLQGRGPTLCVKVWTLPEGVRVSVSLNNLGLPIGKNAAMLSNFLGTLARDGLLAPLTYQNWKSIPKRNKDVMWHVVKLKFDVAPPFESSVLKCLRKKWRTWRSHLKRKHYDSHITEEERLADCDPRVLKEQWRFLVAYWNTEKAKAASARCKASRAKSTFRNTTGSKSFARLFEEESRSHDQTRKHSEGSGGDGVSALGAERRGNTRNNEPRTCPSDLQDKAALKLKASFREAVEAKRIAEDEAATLRKKMTVMEESQKKLQEDLSNMKNTVSAMQRMMPMGGLPGGLMGEPTGPPSFRQDRNAPSFHDVLQPYIDYSALYNPSSSSQQTP